MYIEKSCSQNIKLGFADKSLTWKIESVYNIHIELYGLSLIPLLNAAYANYIGLSVMTNAKHLLRKGVGLAQ